MKKKLISIFLCMVMVLSILSLCVFAGAPTEINLIMVQLPSPALGQKIPTAVTSYTTFPAGVPMSFKLDWYENYAGDWKIMKAGDKFKIGKKYSVDITGSVNTQDYRVSSVTAGTVNGQPHVNTFGEVDRDNMNDRAYLCADFGELFCNGNKKLCPGKVFTDMPKYGNWAHDGIDYAVSNGLFNGMSATTFEPNTAMSRAMFVTVLYRLEGSPDVFQPCSYKDVKEGAWYDIPVSWATNIGVVTGVSADRFDPDAPVTREQIATLLFRYTRYKHSVGKISLQHPAFPDWNKVSKYAEEAMCWALSKGFIAGSKVGNETRLLPRDSATRAQVATILMRYDKGAVEPN